MEVELVCLEAEHCLVGVQTWLRRDSCELPKVLRAPVQSND